MLHTIRFVERMHTVFFALLLTMFLFPTRWSGRDLYDIIGDEHYFENVPIDSMLDVFYQILLKLSCLHSDRQILHGGLCPIC